MVITVTQLNNYLTGVVDMDSTLSNVEVRGELTNVKQSHGNWYFSIKDSNSQIDCFAWSNSVPDVVGGLEVIARGTVNFLPKFAKISIAVNSITPINQGQNSLELAQLKEKLDKQGIFDLSRKKSLPQLPTKIGVVTSQSGAVIQDILEVVSRRQPFTDIVLYPVHVQGALAVAEITQGINEMSSSDVDVLIVARGGGSEEDLSAFNSESVVMAISHCQVPIISAIGHGIDYTLSDMVADVTAVTPTEAAEYATTDCQLLSRSILQLIDSMQDSISERLDNISRHIVASCYTIIQMYENRLLQLHNNVKSNLQQIQNVVNNKLMLVTSTVEKQLAVLSANNPINVLKRGYSLITIDNKTVNSSKDLAIGDRLDIRLGYGAITADVVEVKDEQ